MSDYLGYISSIYKGLNTTGANTGYSSLIQSLTGVDSATGLEGISELSEEENNKDFMSVLTDCMDSDSSASSTAPTSETIQKAYEYLTGQQSSSVAVDNLYNNVTAVMNESQIESQIEASIQNSMDEVGVTE